MVAAAAAAAAEVVVGGIWLARASQSQTGWGKWQVSRKKASWRLQTDSQSVSRKMRFLLRAKKKLDFSFFHLAYMDTHILKCARDIIAFVFKFYTLFAHSLEA